jgi:hypothetical protein
LLTTRWLDRNGAEAVAQCARARLKPIIHKEKLHIWSRLRISASAKNHIFLAVKSTFAESLFPARQAWSHGRTSATPGRGPARVARVAPARAAAIFLIFSDRETFVRANWGLAGVVLGFGAAASGVAMLVLPAAWYGAAAVAPHASALDPHFVRDVGAAYVSAGIALLWFGLDARARVAALMGGVFLVLHALVRAAEALADGSVSLSDLISLFAPLAMWPPLS